MPELPEVETVRRGLEEWVLGRRISTVDVLHPRSIRRHIAGSADFATRLAGARIDGVHRRGKYLWLALSGTDTDADTDTDAGSGGDSRRCLVAHLGMSGQLLVQPPEMPRPTHLRASFGFQDGGPELRFVDQRTFGGLVLDRLVPTAAARPPEPGRAPDSGPRETVPELIQHIARDPLDRNFDDLDWGRRAGRRTSAVKRLLLDQGLISGVGNIYADESLWRARLHGLRPGSSLAPRSWATLLGHVRDVMTEALAQGGTSFDALYVNVNGRSGYFDRSLAVYGQEGRPCPRCLTPVRRSPFMNRSSFWCPRCQRPPAPTHI